MTATLPPALAELLRGGPYQSYTYGYPHKTAYRPLSKPVALRDAWANEKRDSLFLYLHIPFCEMRCGFCNLFTVANAPLSLERAYLDALERQMKVVRGALDGAKFSRLAIGGGTPTFLEAQELERVFDLLDTHFGVAGLPASVETSPATATPERLQVLAGRGVSRVSIGVQSFLESEVRGVGRAQSNAEVWTALDNIRAAGLPALNIDLIYGLAHQTPQTWLESLETALMWTPEELFLYPLYVRPLTGIGRLGRTWDDERLELYRLGREFLTSRGYLQTSMRRFQRDILPLASEPEYACQLDGMVGLGCGARSYTRGLHYSSEYAVGRVGVREIIQDFVQQPAGAFEHLTHGIYLSEDERQRRYVLQSLLHISGLNLEVYCQQFGGNALADFPPLVGLADTGLARLEDGVLTLTPAGMELSDAIGPWLYSPAVRALSEAYEWS
ncbi:STM4012 family radical SAM protein [Deinococcus humi]|uniref:Oxygen-independent coproporphyrinogen-3 oxidase n=1 Tax=Deinococcus humi TaxID=662880 RepID=A0A7W8NC83_9DEIO|nr:STM4012 family radical SAM protein [Deinococcus humi]MBB5361051.1 oxygen-independent coproporphyrinogen-3 oxidase [Deinococcus humi]GGO18215.1 coproporphyrinogen III oxidase [Deinococcus humi]